MRRRGEDPDRSAAHVQAKIMACLVQDITAMDQADIYGDHTAEARLGKALRAAPGLHDRLRDRLKMVTKCGIDAPSGKYAGAACKHYDTLAAHIRASAKHSLHDPITDRIGLLLIRRLAPLMDVGETGAALDELATLGKVRAAGLELTILS